MTAFLDTNVAVYAYDRSDPDKRRVAQQLMNELALELVVSAQVLAEFYWVTTRRLDPPLAADLAKEATNALASLPVVAGDAALVLTAIDVAAQAGISFWDAMIVGAARRAGCDEIITEDMNDTQGIEGIRIRNPFG